MATSERQRVRPDRTSSDELLNATTIALRGDPRESTNTSSGDRSSSDELLNADTDGSYTQSADVSEELEIAPIQFPVLGTDSELNLDGETDSFEFAAVSISVSDSGSSSSSVSSAGIF